MAFILGPGNQVVSFCEYSDVTDRDTRLFEANEVIADSGLVDNEDGYGDRATEKILYEIKNTTWWQSYFLVKDQGATNVSTLSTIDVPVPNATKFIARQQDWTDLCVYKVLYEYLLPKVADFSNEDNAEYKKLGFYREKYQNLFRQLIDAGDWYDFDGSGAITNQEKMPTRTNIVRVR
jgi:hypothetical protein